MLLVQYLKSSNSKGSSFADVLHRTLSNLVISRRFSEGNYNGCIKSHVQCLKPMVLIMHNPQICGRFVAVVNESSRKQKHEQKGANLNLINGASLFWQSSSELLYPFRIILLGPVT